MNSKFLSSIFFVCLLVISFFQVSSVQAKSYEITAACARGYSTNGADDSTAWPSVTAPACSLDYVDYFYADRLSPGMTPVPADYDAATSDPWISSIGAELWYHSSSYDGLVSCLRGGTIFNCVARTNNAGTSKDFYVRDDSGTIIASNHAVSSSSGRYWYFSCAYRICVELDPCDKSTAPDCTIAPTDPCLDLPGECKVSPSGTAYCEYSVNTNECDADGDNCTIDHCTTNDGVTGTCEVGTDVCAGLVPCGRLRDDLSTTWNETGECKVCHVVLVLSNIIDFLMTVVAVLAVLGIIIVAFLSITASANVSTNVSARKALYMVLYGFAIVFVAWVAVNMAMVMFGFIDPLGDGSWQMFDCSI